MSYAGAIGWERGITLSFGKKKAPPEDGWTWSYADDFLPILQQTHGLWVLRNALRHMHVLTSEIEVPPRRDNDHPPL